jgi:hypothetical protein
MKRAADIITAASRVKSARESTTGARLYATHEEIALLAYGLCESRGRQDGHHIEDWLRAEQELDVLL